MDCMSFIVYYYYQIYLVWNEIILIHIHLIHI